MLPLTKTRLGREWVCMEPYASVKPREVYLWRDKALFITFLVVDTQPRPGFHHEVRVLVCDCHDGFRVKPGETTWWPDYVLKVGRTYRLA